MTAFQFYSREVRSIPMLPVKEQEALAVRFASQRDPRDGRQLVLANLRLVVAIARTLGGKHRSDLMDLVQEGNAGLMVGIDRFDPGRGIKLSSYAAIWIRAYIMRHMMESGHVVRATTTVEGRRRYFAHALPSDVCLDAPAGRDDDGGGVRATRLDFLTADEQWRPDVAAEKHHDLCRLHDAVARLETTLDVRQRAILKGRLLCENPRPLRQLGATIDLSGERVRQLEQQMLARLRALVVDQAPQPTRAAAA